MTTKADLERRPLESGDYSRKAFGGTFVRKDRWGLSWRGRLVIVLSFLTAVYLAGVNVRPFLAVTKPVQTNVLVVEGWIQGYALAAARDEFNRGPYDRIFTTGGPENGIGGYINDYQTWASVGEVALEKLGISPALVQMVPSKVSARERTYSSAVALRDWCREHNETIQSLNVLTEDCHARRTWLLYQKVFGDKVKVGIINVANPDYDPNDWWRYSDGVREVLGESIAYIYARLLFHPQNSPVDVRTTQESISPMASKE